MTAIPFVAIRAIRVSLPFLILPFAFLIGLSLLLTITNAQDFTPNHRFVKCFVENAIARTPKN
jgi:hypothetical protein